VVSLQSRPPARRAAEGVLEFAAPVANGRGGWRIPIVLRANVELDLQGLTFSAGAAAISAGATLDFVASGPPPGITDRGVPGKIGMAWLEGWHADAGQVVSVGYLETSTSPERIHWFGVSANAAGSGRPVAIYLSVQDVKVR
jgi:hypothetical protein